MIIKLLALLACSLVVIRAFTLPIAHDEAVTFLSFASQQFSVILQTEEYIHPNIANNHILNTLLIKLSTTTFGISEHSIRLPAIIGFALYCFGVIGLTRRFRSRSTQLLATLPLLFFPYILDLSSAGRGYSLALAGTVLSLYFLLSLLDNKKQALLHIAAVPFFALMAPLSIFSFVHVFIALLGIQLFLALYYFNKGRYSLNTVLATIIFQLLACTLLIAVYAPFVFKASQLGYFYIGGSHGFFTDTVASLLTLASYENSSPPYQIIWLFKRGVGVLLGVIPLILTIKHFKNKSLDIDTAVFYFLWIIPMITIIVLNELFGILYITERSALFFIPISILLLASLLEELQTLIPKKVLTISSYALVIVFGLLFSTQIQLSHFVLWPYDKHSKEAFTLLQGQPNSTKHYITWLFEPSISFYTKQNNPGSSSLHRDHPRACTQLDHALVLDGFEEGGIRMTEENIQDLFGLKKHKEWSETPRTIYYVRDDLTRG